MTKAKLIEGPVNAILIRMTLPMIVGIFSIMAFNMADTYFVGQLGTLELAAMSFTFPVVTTFGSFALGIGVGTSSVISRYIGEGATSKVRRLATDSIFLSVVIVLFFVICGYFTIDYQFQFMGASQEILPLIREYMEIWYLSMPFIVIPMVGNSVIRATGDTKFPAIIMVIVAVVNIILDPLFIFGWGPIEPMGLRGAAIATFIARFITLIASLSVLIFREKLLTIQWPGFKTVYSSWKSILSIGLPAGANNVVIPLSMGWVTKILSVYGEEIVAAFGVGMRIEQFCLIFIMGMSATMGPFVGQNWGAKKLDRIQMALRSSYIFCFTWTLFCAVLILILGESITRPFNDNNVVAHSSYIYLSIMSWSFIGHGVLFVANSTLNAIGKPKLAILLTVTKMLLLYIPLSYLFQMYWGFQGVFWAGFLSNILIGMLSYYTAKKHLR